MNTLRRAERFGPWVASICRNVARDMVRERARRATVDHGCDKDEPDCDEVDREAMVTKAVEELPQQLREAVFLRFYDGMSYQQMTHVLATTEQAIDGRLRRAKKRIAGYLKKRGIGN